MEALLDAIEAVSHVERLWPELAGGFFAYWLHVTHHRLFGFVLKWFLRRPPTHR